MMKMKNITKVLSFVLLLAVVFTAVFLAGCEEKATTADVQTIKVNITSDVEAVQKDLDAAKATITQLQAALDDLTNASATKVALGEAIENIAANKAAAETALAAVNADLATLKTTEIKNLQDALTALSADAATDEELAGAVALINATLADLASDEDLAAVSAQVLLNQAAILDLAETDEEVAKAIEDIEAALEAIDDFATDAELTAAINTLADAIDAKLANYATDEELAGVAAQVLLNQTSIQALAGEAEDLEAAIALLATKAELTAAVNEINTAIAALAGSDDVAAAVAAINETIATLATKAELAAEVATLNATVANLATAEQLTADKAALQAEITGNANAIAALQETVTGLQNSINGQIKAINETIAGLDSTYATDVALAAAVEDLQNQIDSVSTGDNSFAKKYNDATDILYDEEGEFSIYAFDDIADEVDADDYADAVYAAFEKYAYNLKLKLNRALNVDSIEAIFEQLETYIANMETLSGSLIAEMDRIENGTKITLEEGQLDALKAIYAKIQDKGTVLDEEVAARYEAFLAARARLEAAQAAAVALGGPAAAVATLEGNVNVTKLPYNTYNTQINNIGTQYAAIATEYFSEDDSALYGITVEDLAGYKPTTNHRGYIEFKEANDALNAAKAALDAVELTVLPEFKELNPIFSDLADINADIALIEAWGEETGVSADNFIAIYNASKAEATGNLDRVYAAQAYAVAMDAIYNTYVLNEEEEIDLLADVNAELEKGAAGVLYTYIETLEGVWADMGELHAAIAAVTGYDKKTDGNYDAMLDLDADDYETITAIQNKVLALQEADLAVKALNKQAAELIGFVSFADFGTITDFELQLADIFADDLDPELSEANATNYEVLAGPEFEKTEDNSYEDYKTVCVEGTINYNLAALWAEYYGLTARVQEVYDRVKDTVYGADASSLTDLQKIIVAKFTMAEIEGEVGIDVPNFGLIDPERLGMTYKAFIEDLDDTLNELTALAREGAEPDAYVVGELIKELDVENFNLNNLGQFNAAINAFINWVNEYICEFALLEGEEVTIADNVAKFGEIAYVFADADELGLNGGINAITEYVYRDRYYAFLTAEDYAKIVEAYETALTMAAAAEADWEEILAAYDELPTGENNIDIHDVEFDAWQDLYNNYVFTYYGGVAEDEETEEVEYNAGKIVNPMLAEPDTYTAFEVNYAIYLAKVTDAAKLYTEIIGKAAALRDLAKGIPAAEDIDEIRAGAADLLALIEEYRDVYCVGGTDDCADQCKFIVRDEEDKIVVDAELIAYQCEAKALEAYIYYNGLGNEQLTDRTLSSAINDKIDLYKKVSYVESAYKLFLNTYLAKPTTEDGTIRKDLFQMWTAYFVKMQAFYNDAIALNFEDCVVNIGDALELQEELNDAATVKEALEAELAVLANDEFDYLDFSFIDGTSYADFSLAFESEIDNIELYIGDWEQDWTVLRGKLEAAGQETDYDAVDADLATFAGTYYGGEITADNAVIDELDMIAYYNNMKAYYSQVEPT